MPSETLILDIPESRSSLVRRIEYFEYNKLLFVYVRYNQLYVYEEVYKNHFEEFCKAKSMGNYFIKYIKPNFKLKNSNIMLEEKKRPPTKNQASDQVRWIDFSINVREIIKEWIVAGKDGDYLGMKLRMLPDGQTDKYGSLGMIVQTVPTSVYKAAEAKEKGSGKKIQGPILGNAAELDWGNRGTEGQPGQLDGDFISQEQKDDLPF